MSEINTSNREPTLDYWMLSILQEAVKELTTKRTRGRNEEYIREQVEKKNEWNPIGQLEKIKERLTEMQTYFDGQIKSALDEARKVKKT